MANTSGITRTPAVTAVIARRPRAQRVRRVAALPVALVTLALTQSAASAIATPAPDPVTSILDGLTPHHLVVADGVERTTYSADSSPLVVRVAVIDPDKGAVSVRSTVGAAVGMKEATTKMLATVGASAADRPHVGVNGGYSVAYKDEDAAGKGILEDRSIPMVASVQEDVVQGASCTNGQNAVVLQHGRPHFTRITTTLQIKSLGSTAGDADDAIRTLDGVNRYPGWIPFCRQSADDRLPPFLKDADGQPVRDAAGKLQYVDEKGRVIKSGPYYEDDGEIVVFTSGYGLRTPYPDHTPFVKADNAEGVEVAVDAGGYVVSKTAKRGGTAIPANGMVLQGIGSAQNGDEAGAKWLDEHAKVGTKLVRTQQVTDIGFNTDPADDEDLALDPAHPSVDVVNGTHLLMRDNEVVPPEEGGNERPDPRTAIGTDATGRTLLVVVTSKTEGERLGVPIHDLAKIMQDLGAVDALNLDGGGSTTFVVDGQVKNVLADPGGVERPVYDSVYAGRGGHGLPATGG
ncbi:phosphodiester glycosidase family protein [Streptomyces sp. NPDC101166]|uniref:phosphodiester glycosidase family protein n=1 Tax=Streptomyces sp. NPDC101166 TaxID=3366120 RepID=UPI003804AEA8